LDTQYIRPFEILERIRPLTYRPALPLEMKKLYNVYHVSQLRKYISDPSHILNYSQLQIQEDMSYTEEPMQILDRKEKQLRDKMIPIVKI